MNIIHPDSKFKTPLLLTCPHSGETIPKEAQWLTLIQSPILYFDIDRYVDQLYQDAVLKTDIPMVTTPWHRYAVDLNRKATDIDELSVCNAPTNPKHPHGLHWQKTTQGHPLLTKPISNEIHQSLVQNYHAPFYNMVQNLAEQIKKVHGYVLHLDLHSCPSQGTSSHRDPGETRAEIILSDQKGKSANSKYFKSIKELLSSEFNVVENWPYFGGCITQHFGHPGSNHHCLQIEINRGLYMNEETKEKNNRFNSTKNKTNTVIKKIYKLFS